MERTAIDRRSMGAGIVGLIIAQALLGGVFWVGFRAGEARTVNDPAPSTSTPEPIEVPTSAGSVAVDADDRATQDPCAAAFVGPGVCFLGAVTGPDGDLVVELEYRNLATGEVGFDGIHAHVFPSDTPPERAGTPGAVSTGGGDFTVTDATTLQVSGTMAEELARTGEICVATADEMHSLVHLHVSCVAINAE